MSMVTGLVLMCSVAEAESNRQEPFPVLAIQAWIAEKQLPRLANVTDYASGNKHPQCFIYAAGYNHFDEEGFSKFIQSLKWEYPENVMLIMQPENGPTKAYSMAGEVNDN